jgi:hypothetical protein
LGGGGNHESPKYDCACIVAGVGKICSNNKMLRCMGVGDVITEKRF